MQAGRRHKSRVIDSRRGGWRTHIAAGELLRWCSPGRSLPGRRGTTLRSTSGLEDGTATGSQPPFRRGRISRSCRLREMQNNVGGGKCIKMSKTCMWMTEKLPSPYINRHPAAGPIVLRPACEVPKHPAAFIRKDGLDGFWNLLYCENASGNYKVIMLLR